MASICFAIELSLRVQSAPGAARMLRDGLLDRPARHQLDQNECDREHPEERRQHQEAAAIAM